MIFPNVLRSTEDLEHIVRGMIDTVEPPGEYLLVDRNITSMVSILTDDPSLSVKIGGFTATKIDKLGNVALYKITNNIFGDGAYAAIAYRHGNVIILDSTYFPLQKETDVMKLRLVEKINHVIKEGKVPLNISRQEENASKDYLDDKFTAAISVLFEDNHVKTEFGFTDSADFIEWELSNR